MASSPSWGASSLFLGGEIYRSSSYGAQHPLSIPRVSTAIDLSRAMGWLDERHYRDSPVATPEQLGRFHTEGYVQALLQAERDQALPEALRQRHRLGTVENPFFTEMFRRPATAAGASLLGAALVLAGGTVYNPAGGTHHGRPDRASGFCYVNDAVLGILALLDAGLDRVYYVDLDAHHGDGVQDAFAEDARVLTVSVHEAGRWPRTGLVDDRAGGQARNLPVPAGFNDSELAYVVAEALLPLGEAFAPEAVVIQCGADALAEDPLSGLALSNRGLWQAVAALLPLAPRRLVLGGGGYNPWSVGRCWCGIWAVISGHDPAAPLTPAAEAVLRGLHWHRLRGAPVPEHWVTTLADQPRPGAVRPEVRRLVAEVRRPPAVGSLGGLGAGARRIPDCPIPEAP